MANEEVLREFLVSLGFAVDQTGMKKFTGSLGSVGKEALFVGKAVTGVALAAEAMVTAFSSQMEKLYYASRRTGASVENIQALSYGARQVGISSEASQSALENLSGALRLNPGMVGLLANLGVKTEGVDRTRVLIDLVQKLSSMPHFVGAKFASMFGLDEPTFLALKNGLPELIKAEEQRIAMNRNAGISSDDAAAASREYMNALRELRAQIEVVGQDLAIKLLPYFRKAIPLVKEFISLVTNFRLPAADVSKFSSQMGEMLDRLHKLKDMFSGVGGPGLLSKFFGDIGDSVLHLSHALLGLTNSLLAFLSGDFKGAGKDLKDMFSELQKGNPISVVANLVGGAFNPTGEGFHMGHKWAPLGHIGPRGDPMAGMPGHDRTNDQAETGGNAIYSSPEGATTSAKLFARDEAEWELPPGILDKIWAAESGRGQHMLSSAGAQGHFQFMPETAKQYGVVDPNNLSQSAEGAAHMMHDLLVHFHGDLQKAVAAYNWGAGNVDKYGLGAAPSETRNYVAKIAGGAPTINQQTTINVTGSNSPDSTAKAIASEQKIINADIVRNMKGVIQ